ncbi:MAG: TonB-dependent receptor plug domain-containing protein [Acidobacteriota bacterium]
MLFSAGVLLALGFAQEQTEKPPPVRTSLTVLERIEQETPAAITTLDKLDVAKAPGVNLDDRLRLVPGFSLFRRNSSLAANPTTQGVSLRGLGSSGASRTLVIWDGIPLNDPFGGWIYWTRVPAEEVDRAEITRGATTSLFGDRTMSGSVALFTRPAEPRRLSLGLEGGNLGTLQPSAGFSHLFKRLAVSTFFRAFDTDGYLIVPANRAGRIDTPAAVRFASGAIKLEYLAPRDRLSFKLDILAEERANGTPLQTNSTSLGALSATYSRDFGLASLGAILYHQRQQYHQSFSALAADRNSERLTSFQSVPSEATGYGLFWKRRPSRFNFTAGNDLQYVNGASRETVIPTGLRIGAGDQRQTGLFGQGDARFGRLQLFYGSRGQFSGRAGNFYQPSGGLALELGAIRYRASAYRSFRAPTLNELFREFRAGNAVTQANPDLRPEKLWAVESGLDYRGELFEARIGGFYKEVANLIANVTLSQTPAQIIRQRRNAASATVRGIEIEFQKRYKQFRFESSYLMADSRFVTGERLPQVPRHQGSAQLTWYGRKTLLTASMRASGLQFEDDRNSLLLPGFALFQITAGQTLHKGLVATLAVENLANREILTGFTPFPQTGAPRLFRIGLRWMGGI